MKLLKARISSEGVIDREIIIKRRFSTPFRLPRSARARSTSRPAVALRRGCQLRARRRSACVNGREEEATHDRGVKSDLAVRFGVEERAATHLDVVVHLETLFHLSELIRELIEILSVSFLRLERIVFEQKFLELVRGVEVGLLRVWLERRSDLLGCEGTPVDIAEPGMRLEGLDAAGVLAAESLGDVTLEQLCA